MRHLFFILIFTAFNVNAAMTDISPIGKVNLAESPMATKPPANVEPAPAAPAAAQEPMNTMAKPAPAADAATAAESGAIDAKAIYAKSCFACHATGAANAPKLGDKAAWAPRIATGMDALLNTAINDKGAMPPKGGALNLTEAEIKAVVEYMLESVK